MPMLHGGCSAISVLLWVFALVLLASGGDAAASSRAHHQPSTSSTMKHPAGTGSWQDGEPDAAELLHDQIDHLYAAYTSHALSLDGFISAGSRIFEAAASSQSSDEARARADSLQLGNWEGAQARRLQEVANGMSGQHVTVVAMEDTPFVTRTSGAFSESDRRSGLARGATRPLTRTLR